MFITLFVLFVVLIILYCKVKYFTLRGPIPGLSPNVFLGNAFQAGLLFNKVPLPKALQTFQNRFGDIYQFWFGPTRLIVVSGVDDVQHIFANRQIYDQGDMCIQIFSTLLPDGLICLKGAEYKRHASYTIHLFHRGKIVSNLDIIIDSTDKLLANWRACSSQHIHRDIYQQCESLMLEVFGWIGFDYNLETLDGNQRNEFCAALISFFSIFEMVCYMPRFLNILYMKLSRRHKRVKQTIEQYLNRIIDTELDQSEESRIQRKRKSLIASLVASLDEDTGTGIKKGLSRNEVLHEILMFLIAGYETSATMLTWFIHLMSKNPRIQQKIKTELIDTGAQQHLSLDRLDSLVYLDCVIKEVLRYAPPASMTFRTLAVDDCLPQSGTKLFKGDTVLIALNNLARDNRLWSIDPDLFYPERFLNEDKNHHPYAFIPFGGGHRQCIGQDLAKFQLKVIIVRLMQCVTFGDGGPEVNSGGQHTHISTIPRHIGVTMNFDK